MPDGQVDATFRWLEQSDGAHAGNAEYNQRGIGICLIGNFEHSLPTPRQIEASGALIATLTREFELTANAVLPHRSVRSTACPGGQFPLEALKKMAVPLPLNSSRTEPLPRRTNPQRATYPVRSPTTLITRRIESR